ADRSLTLHLPPAHQDAAGYRHDDVNAGYPAAHPAIGAKYWHLPECVSFVHRSAVTVAKPCREIRLSARQLYPLVQPDGYGSVRRRPFELTLPVTSPRWSFYRCLGRRKSPRSAASAPLPLQLFAS